VIRRVVLVVAILMTAVPATAGSRNAGGGQLDQPTLFRMVGNLYGVDPDLLRAIAAVESGGDSRAVSPAGALGLMQLMPGTARRFGVEDPFDIVDNLFGAVRYLDHLQRWETMRSGNKSVVDMLAAYNAGEKAVERYGGVPPYAETQEYVRRVLLAYVLTGLIRRSPAAGNGSFTNRIAPIPRWTGNQHPGVINPQQAKSLPVVDVFDQLAEIRKTRALMLNRQRTMATTASSQAERR
jgi:hypothetical protein